MFEGQEQKDFQIGFTACQGTSVTFFCFWTQGRDEWVRERYQKHFKCLSLKTWPGEIRGDTMGVAHGARALAVFANPDTSTCALKLCDSVDPICKQCFESPWGQHGWTAIIRAATSPKHNELKPHTTGQISRFYGQKSLTSWEKLNQRAHKTYHLFL